MIEYQKTIVWVFVTVLLSYMLWLASLTRKKWEFKTEAFAVLIIGISLLNIGTFLDMIEFLITYKYLHIFIKICLSLGAIIYIIGVILWSNYTKQLITKFEAFSLTDDMTGALNRKGIERVYHWVAQINKPFFIIVCDLDETKKINDQYGHSTGDIYIKSTADIIIDTVGINGYLGRIGGDEFVVILKCEDIEQIKQMILAIKQSVSKIFAEQITEISMGYAFFPEDGELFADLIKVADRRMYEDKKNRKNENK